MSSSDSSVGPSFFSSSLATAGGPNSVDEWISDRSCYRNLSTIPGLSSAEDTLAGKWHVLRCHGSFWKLCNSISRPIK